MKGACHKGEEAFRRQGTALDAVVAAITVLEVCFGSPMAHQCLEQIWGPTRRSDPKQAILVTAALHRHAHAPTAAAQAEAGRITPNETVRLHPIRHNLLARTRK